MKKNTKNTTFQELVDTRQKFVRDRGWEAAEFDTKSLVIAAMSELGELAEHYMWRGMRWTPESEKEKKAVMFELIDVLNYLFGLIDRIDGVDFCEEYFKKMEKLGEKYPVGMTGKEYRKRKEEYRRLGKNKLYEDTNS